MKNRDHDAPVKIIQILPVDNELSKPYLKPQKPPDFSSMGRNVVEVSRQAAAWMKAASVRVRKEIERHVQDAGGSTPVMSSEAGRADSLTSHAPLKSADIAVRPALPERLPDIVVCDLVPIGVPTPSTEPDLIEQDAQLAGCAYDRRVTPHRKADLVEKWLHERDEIDAAGDAAREKFRALAGAVRRVMAATRLRLWKVGKAVVDLFRPAPELAEITALQPDRAVVRELTHDLAVTKATLLAQQQALENITVQLSAVQKELARHKNLLSGLMTQVEAVDLKIVRTTQVTARKTRIAAESGPETCKADLLPGSQSVFEDGELLPEAAPARMKTASPRRSLAKKTALSVERSREHRA